MLERTEGARDYYAGGIMLLFGAAAVQEGVRLGVGSLTDMGPGYLPLALGMLLACLGVIIAFQRVVPSVDPFATQAASAGVVWRGRLCIILSVIAFIFVSQYAGLIAATLVSVTIAAVGDRTARVKESICLAIGTSAFGAVLFHYVLQIPIPLFPWNAS